jgi:tetratricopeptide (TPR) repeat protein
MSLLAQEPRARPTAAEIAVALGHLCSPAPGPERPETATLLVGREPELKQLDEALAEVRSGKPATVLLDGNPGVGKTTLVERFLERVEADGETITLRGRCYERERVPYQGIDSLMDDLCRLLSTTERSTTRAMLPRNVTALVRLFPLLERVPVISEWSDEARFTRVEQQELRRLAFGALRDMLARVGERRTLVLHIDDLQWGDLDTAALLREVLRPPDAPVMLLILGFRREDRATSACLRVLVDDDLGSPIELHLNPLRTTDADELLHKLLRVELPQDQVAQLTSQAEGNPLFIQMMARFATDPDAHRTPEVPLDLGGALGACIKALPSRARALLDTLSVAGNPLSEHVARRAAGFSGPLWEEWDLLNGQHLVRSSGIHEERTLETFHDRIRQAVLGVLPPERARECHRALAEALERTGSADPDSLAGHHEAAGNIERALHFTVEAATQADQALAFDRAARLFQRALALASSDDARRPALMVARAQALANAGRCEQAAGAFREAAEHAEPEERTALLRRAAEQLLFGGQIDEARELIRSDLRAVGFPLARDSRSAMLAVLLHRLQLRFRGLEVRDDSQTRASAEERALLEHIYRVCIGLSGVDLFIGGEMAARYMLRALEMGEARSIARGLCLITGHAAIEAPSSRRTRSLLQTMIAQGERLGDHLVDTSVRTVQGLQAYFEGHWREALAHFDEVEKRIHEEHQGLVWEMWTSRAVAIWSLFFLGDWNELERRVLTGLREAGDRGNLYATQCVSASFGIVAWLVRNQAEEARSNLDDITGRWRVRGFQLQNLYFMIADIFVLLFSGRGADAWSRLNGRWRVVAGSAVTLRLPMFRSHELHVRGCCAIAAAAAEPPQGGARRRLLGEAVRASRRLDGIGLPHAHWLAELLRAGIDVQEGRMADSLGRLEGAREALDRLEMFAFSAAARRRIAQLRGEHPPDFLPGQGVVNPDGIARMLLPGFPEG